MPDESSHLEEQPRPSVQADSVQADSEPKHRKLGDEEFKAKLEMTKAFCDGSASSNGNSTTGKETCNANNYLPPRLQRGGPKSDG